MHCTSTENLILEISRGMKDPLCVKAFMLDPVNANPDPFVPHSAWDDLSLGCGYPSFLLLFATLEHKGLVEEGIAHQYVLKIKETIESEGLLNLSLFSGVSGICFALQQASFDGKRYQKMLGSLHTFLLERIEVSYFGNQPRSSTLYDVIQGLSGIGRYILEHIKTPHFFECAQNIAKALISLCQPYLRNGYQVPGWHLGPKDILNMRKTDDPNGNFNLGLAHGVPGILAFLSIAFLRGVVVEGQREMIGLICTWIQEKGRVRWPCSISFEDEVEGRTNLKGCKDAWCYGAPGIARTLFLAGKALGDEGLKSFAAGAFREIFARSREEWQLPGPMLCHGIAGLLMITLEMSKEMGCEDLKQRVDELYQILVTSFDPQAPFGFKDIEQCRNGGSVALNKAGFLDGSAGVALTLLSLEDRNLRWYLPLMIHD